MRRHGCAVLNAGNNDKRPQMRPFERFLQDRKRRALDPKIKWEIIERPWFVRFRKTDVSPKVVRQALDVVWQPRLSLALNAASHSTNEVGFHFL